MVYRSPEKKLQQQRRRRIWVALLLILCLIFFGGIIFILRLDFWQIKNIEVYGNKLVITEEILPIVKRKIEGECWLTVPCANRLFFSTEISRRDILAKFLVIKNVIVNVSGQTLQITVEERQPQDLWCNEGAISMDCYFMDSTGYIFVAAPYFSTGFLIWNGGLDSDIIESGDTTQVLGQQVLDPDRFQNWRWFADRFVTEIAELKQIQISDDLEIVFDLYNNLKIIFYRDGDLDEIWQTLQLLRREKYLDDQTIAYIDLSFIKNNQVFYCRRGEVCETNF